MRDRVNISIDHRIKEMFEDLKEVHGKEWNEWFEEATIEFLMKIAPVQALEFVVKIEDEKQEQRKIALIRAKANMQVMKPSPGIDNDLERRREEMFQTDITFLPKQIIRGDANWNRILLYYEFETKKEAMAWLRPRIIAAQKVVKMK